MSAEHVGEPPAPEHAPGDPHAYVITCTVCGQPGTLRFTVDPERVEAPAWAPPAAAGYAYDSGEPSACRSCCTTIRWAIHETTSKRMPVNPDGTSHFATCPQADAWRKRAARDA